MIGASLEQIRLPFLPGNFGGTSAAGAGASFADDTLPRLRTLFGATRLAGRVALTQLRSVVKPCRAITTAFRTNSFNVVQRGPSAVCVVASACPLFIRAGHRVAPFNEDQQTSFGLRAGCTGSAEIKHGSRAQ